MTATALLFAAAMLAPQTLPPSSDQLLNDARWYILVERWDDAIKAAQAFEARHPGTPRIPEARYLRHKARLFQILDRARDDPPMKTAVPLMKDLEALTLEPMDDATAAAKLALGTLHYLATSRRNPEALVKRTLEDWLALDQSRAVVGVPSAIHQDVVAIRDLVFQPFGGGVFAGDTRWADFKWAERTAPYLFVNPAVRVRIASDRSMLMRVDDPLPKYPNVIFIGSERRTLIDRIMLTLGTARRRSWMKSGKALDVMTLWMKASFGARGRWGGWLFETYPRTVAIEFLDAERTRAKVQVLVGYSGGTVWLEKRNDEWVATGVRNFWTEGRLKPAPTLTPATACGPSARASHRRACASAAPGA